jgi:protein-S-isoprenylcysteine O-methyltransferase Ste14
MLLTLYLTSAFLLLVAALVAFRLFGRRDYQRKGRPTPFSLFLQTLIFFLWGGFPYIYGPSDWPAVHLGPILEAIGWIALGVGLAVMFAAMAGLGLRRTFGQEPNLLKQTGLYRLTRNPQIVGCGLYGIGFALLWPSWYALGWAVLYAAIAHMMVLTEEEHLRDVHGEAYLRYCERVPRYLGFWRGS